MATVKAPKKRKPAESNYLLFRSESNAVDPAPTVIWPKQHENVSVTELLADLASLGWSIDAVTPEADTVLWIMRHKQSDLSEITPGMITAMLRVEREAGEWVAREGFDEYKRAESLTGATFEESFEIDPDWFEGRGYTHAVTTWVRPGAYFVVTLDLPKKAQAGVVGSRK